LRILFEKNVPVGVRRFLLKHEVHTLVEMQWPDQLENGELLKLAEQSGLDVMVTSDQNIRYRQNLTGRKLCPGRARVQHLACGAAAPRGNIGESRCGDTGLL